LVLVVFPALAVPKVSKARLVFPVCPVRWDMLDPRVCLVLLVLWVIEVCKVLVVLEVEWEAEVLVVFPAVKVPVVSKAPLVLRELLALVVLKVSAVLTDAMVATERMVSLDVLESPVSPVLPVRLAPRDPREKLVLVVALV